MVMTVKKILDTVGRAQMARELGCGPTNVSNFGRKKKFPSRHMLRIREICQEYGMDEPPERLFDFVPAKKKRAKRQVGA